MSLKENEPLALRGALLALVSPVVALAVSLGLDLDQTQQTTVAAVLTGVVPVVLILWARRHVTPASKVSAPPQE